MAYVPAGFTPEQEQELLSSQRSIVMAQQEQARAAANLDAWTKKQDQIRTITAAGIIVGFIFTLMRMGDLVSQMRERRRARTGE